MSGENDTRHMEMTIDPLPTSGSIILSRSNTNAKVWSAQGKGDQRGVLVGSGTRTWNLADSGERANYQACANALWAEGCGDGSSVLTVTLKDPGGAMVGDDSLKHTYIAALCGRQPKTEDPPPPDDERSRFSGWFPNLTHCEWSITDEENEAYNCIAWSVDETGVWYYPWDIDQDFGDTDGIFEDSDMDAFYSDRKGWSLITSGSKQEKAGQAEAMYYAYVSDWNYVQCPGPECEPKPGYHAARRMGYDCGAGKWIMYESKDGPNERIEHVWNQLNGPDYDEPDRFYR